MDDLFTVLDGFDVEQCVLAGESLGALTCVLAPMTLEPGRHTGGVTTVGMLTPSEWGV